ncbi:MAG TPA: butyrate kinase [Clostridiales bacterium UBA8153]|nr:butyrate kinase [Clostridiales bacterium UBA8153]
MLILAINPGSSSTKVALYYREACLSRKDIVHSEADPASSTLEARARSVREFLAEIGIPLTRLTAIAARGGLLKPVAGGTYAINEGMLADLRAARRGEHASNLAGIMAAALAQEARCPAYVVDPVSVDELEPEARLSGWKELERQSLYHSLNARAVARRAARELGEAYDQVNLVVAHLGSGISVSAHRRGRAVDVSNPNDEGPFSPERAGGLPARPLIALALADAGLGRQLVTRGGLYGYLGTRDAREVERRIEANDAHAELVYGALAYQVAREIGAMAAVLGGEVDAVVLTGGLAYSDFLTRSIVDQIGFMALILRYPGGDEMEALALGVLRVLDGEEACLEYGGGEEPPT